MGKGLGHVPRLWLPVAHDSPSCGCKELESAQLGYHPVCWCTRVLVSSPRAEGYPCLDPGPKGLEVLEEETDSGQPGR